MAKTAVKPTTKGSAAKSKTSTAAKPAAVNKVSAKAAEEKKSATKKAAVGAKTSAQKAVTVAPEKLVMPKNVPVTAEMMEQETALLYADNDRETRQQIAEREEAEAAANRLAARPKVRYSDADLKMFRAHIETERKKAVEEFQILKENLEDITNSEMADENASYSMHMAEQGTNAQEKEKIYAHVQRLSDHIKKLDEALQRINDKVYGICKMCGILIAKERLLAVPITTQSASYKIHKRCPDDGIDRITPVQK